MNTVGTGKRCGASYISQSYTCRIGALGDHEVWGAMSKSDAKKVQKQIEGIIKKVEKEIPEEHHSTWTAALGAFLDENTKGQLSSTKKADSMTSTLTRVSGMVGNQPTELQLLDGSKMEASPLMVPVLRKKQLSWGDTSLGMKYNLPDKNGVAVLKGTSLGKFVEWKDGYNNDMLAFKAAQEKAGKPWPAESVIKVKPAAVKKLADENPNLWRSGFNILDPNKNRDEAFTVYGLNSKNPSQRQLDARRSKNEAVAEAWLAAGKKSPVTGKDIPLPGPPRQGQTRTVVDHLNAITGIRDQVKGDQWEMVRLADRASNYVIVETSLNNSKGNRTWDWTAKNAYSTPKMVKTVRERWGQGGNGVSMSRAQFVKRYGEAYAKKYYDTKKSRVAFGSAMEQKRLSGIFSVPRKTMKPLGKKTKRIDNPPKDWVIPS